MEKGLGVYQRNFHGTEFIWCSEHRPELLLVAREGLLCYKDIRSLMYSAVKMRCPQLMALNHPAQLTGVAWPVPPPAPVTCKDLPCPAEPGLRLLSALTAPHPSFRELSWCWGAAEATGGFCMFRNVMCWEFLGNSFLLTPSQGTWVSREGFLEGR